MPIGPVLTGSDFAFAGVGEDGAGDGAGAGAGAGDGDGAGDGAGDGVRVLPVPVAVVTGCPFVVVMFAIELSVGEVVVGTSFNGT